MRSSRASALGEVYRAHDRRLRRDVALKVLPDSFAANAERLVRFEREAQALAALNHPHIAHIHGVEESGSVRALVMELVEGEDLAARIARGPLPSSEALSIAQQIAAALEAAHERGIIHRDLKPANIRITADGAVKVLDFGLATALKGQESSPQDAAVSPTMTSAPTELGAILGTVAYMSAEQACGKRVDKRTDVWAFGCVLYEMLTGRRAFPDEEVSDVLAAVLARDPDLTLLPSATPPSVQRLLRRCLQRDRKQRLRHMGDADLEIADAMAGIAVESPIAGPAQHRPASWPWTWVAVATLVGVASGATVTWLGRYRPSLPQKHVEIVTPPTAAPTSVVISPDGQTLAFVATADNESRVWLRSLGSNSSRPLAGDHRR